MIWSKNYSSKHERRLGARPGLAFQTRLLLASVAGRNDNLAVAEELYRELPRPARRR